METDKCENSNEYQPVFSQPATSLNLCKNLGEIVHPQTFSNIALKVGPEMAMQLQ